MKTINLREMYPDYYKSDFFIEVSDEVESAIKEAEQAEQAYDRRMYYHKAYYSLDRGDGIENEAALVAQSPHDLYERKCMWERLNIAMAELSPKQAKRVYKRYVVGQKIDEIAECEGVKNSSVSESVCRGLANLKKFLK